MATAAQLSGHFNRPIITAVRTDHRLHVTTTHYLPLPRRQRSLTSRLRHCMSLQVGNETPPTSTVDMEQLVGFLYKDLPHLFDDQGIDPKAYDERVKFRDPITKHDTISGYLFNISLLKNLFTPDFRLHWAKQVFLLKLSTLLCF